MEGLIIAILIGLVTSFLNKKDDKQAKETKPFMPQKQMPSETTQAHRKDKPARPRVQMKSLEDFTRDVMAQLQTKAEPKAEEVAETVKQAAAPKIEQPARQPIEERVKARQQTARTVETPAAAFELATSRQSLQQAIIMAEVLGKPKAKQRT